MEAGGGLVGGMVVEAVVEVPKGCQNKYEFDAARGRMVLDRVLFSPVHYPGEYGFIPDTLEDDGDPLDILVLSSFATFPGCVVPARVLGALRMRDEQGEDLKILAAVAVDPRFAEVQGLEQVPGHVRREVEHFFRVYKELEGQAATVGAWLGAAEAAAAVEAARARCRARTGPPSGS